MLPSVQDLHAIDVWEGGKEGWREGDRVWQLQPEGVDDEDARFATQRWLLYMGLFTQGSHRPSLYPSLAPSLLPAPVVRILASGYLSKKGVINTMYKRRWFVVTSSNELRYYRDENGTLKGFVQLSDVDAILMLTGKPWTAEEAFKGKAISKSGANADNWKVIVLRTADRPWWLQADTVEDAVLWVELLSTVQNLCSSISSERYSYAPSSSFSIPQSSSFTASSPPSSSSSSAPTSSASLSLAEKAKEALNARSSFVSSTERDDESWKPESESEKKQIVL